MANNRKRRFELLLQDDAFTPLNSRRLAISDKFVKDKISDVESLVNEVCDDLMRQEKKRDEKILMLDLNKALEYENNLLKLRIKNFKKLSRAVATAAAAASSSSSSSSSFSSQSTSSVVQPINLSIRMDYCKILPEINSIVPLNVIDRRQHSSSREKRTFKSTAFADTCKVVECNDFSGHVNKVGESQVLTNIKKQTMKAITRKGV